MCSEQSLNSTCLYCPPPPHSGHFVLSALLPSMALLLSLIGMCDLWPKGNNTAMCHKRCHGLMNERKWFHLHRHATISILISTASLLNYHDNQSQFAQSLIFIRFTCFHPPPVPIIIIFTSSFFKDPVVSFVFFPLSELHFRRMRRKLNTTGTTWR